MPKKLTPWQRLTRIAYKYRIRTRGLDVPEIASALLRNRNVTDGDKKHIETILKEWLESNNRE